VHAEVRRRAQYQISCQEAPLQIFWYEYPAKTVQHTLSHGGGEKHDHAIFSVAGFIA